MANFADVQHFVILPCADNADIVGGSEKVQECVDVIYGWSLSYLVLYFVASDEFDEEEILFYFSFCISRLNHRLYFYVYYLESSF